MIQDYALNILKSGRNVFLTGSAGTGKTFVLNQYINYLKDRDIPVAVTASTGIAATHLNGMTIHAWSGIGVKGALTNKDLQNMKSKKYLQKQLQESKVLIIDEISMLHGDQLNMVNSVLKFFKGNELPFGGVQIVASGDFFQLPPVGKPGETNKDKFSFMSRAWIESDFCVCYLTEQYRQSDPYLNGVLNEIREANVQQDSVELLQEAKNTVLDSGWEPTKLYSHNADVDRENQEQLDRLEGEKKTFYAKLKGNEKLLETLKRSVLTDEILDLKIGAKVMFIKNNYDKDYNNGTMGQVVGYSDEDEYPKVETLHGKTITVEPEKWAVENDAGKSLASFTQVPLRLGWAITVHKSQGVTLDAAEIDLTKTFERGQGYVALSRLKDIHGLKLLGFNRTALEVDPLAFKADQRFQELSYNMETHYDEAECMNLAKSFVVRCGGLTTDEEIEKKKKKRAEKAKPKKSTYLLTKEYIEKKTPLEDIADARGMALSTIMGHVVKVKELYPNVDISGYRPAPNIMNKIEAEYAKIKSGNPEARVSMKALFDGMDRKVSYQDIKLALAFIED